MESDERQCEFCAGAGDRLTGREIWETCPACWGSGTRAATWHELGCPCSRCEKPGAEERYSLGIYAGRYCRACWEDWRGRAEDEPDAPFDPSYAGERMDEDY